MTTEPRALFGRRFDLDWLRIAAFSLLILYHTGMLYVPWDFHVKSPHAGPGPVPLMLAINPWRLDLLFLISGAASRFMLEKLPAGSFARQRMARLLVPLVFGMLVIVPPQSYFEVVEKYGFARGFLDFYFSDYLGWIHRYRIADGVQTNLILPTWNHLWFVAYLAVYTLVAAGLAWSPRALTAIESFIDRHATPVRLLLVPALLLSAYRLLLFPHFPLTRALIDDWYGHALYGTMFVIGLFIARSGGVWVAIERVRWAALALAIAGFVAFFFLPHFQGPEFAIIRATGYGTNAWCMTLALLGFGRRWLSTADGPARRYLTDAIFPYYIVHQTALVALAVWLRPLALPALSEFLLVMLGTVACCALTYEIVRRVAWLRAPFGLRRERAAYT